MKKIKIKKWLYQLDCYWATIPIKQQQSYTLLLFLVYLLLTVGIILTIKYDMEQVATVKLEPIENPIFQKRNSSSSFNRSLFSNLKIQYNERK